MQHRLTTIGGRLGVLALAVALPLLLGAGLVAALAWTAESDALDWQVNTQSLIAVRGIDGEIESRRLAIEAFAAARGDIEHDDLAATDAAARRLALALDAQVGVLDRGLGLLVDTSQPFGTPLGSMPAVAAGLWAVETGRARVSSSATGTTPGPTLLMVPIMRSGRASGVISVSLAPERLAAAAASGHSVLFDSRWRIIASNGGAPANLPDWTVLAAAPRRMVQAGEGAAGSAIRYVVTNPAEAPEWHLVTWEPAGFATTMVARLLPWGALCLVVTLAVALVTLARTRATLRTPLLALECHARAAARPPAARHPEQRW